MKYLNRANDMHMARERKLLGTIVEQGNYIAYMYQIGKKRKTINCKGSLALAEEIQLQMTLKKQRGELDPDIEYELTARKKKKDKKKVEEFIQEYEVKMISKKRKDKQSLEDARNSKVFKIESMWLKRFWDIVGVEYIDELDIQTMDSFISTRQQCGVTNSAINREITTLKPMLRYAKKAGYLLYDLADELTKLKVKTEEVVVFPSIESIHKMIDACEKHCPDFLPLLWTYLKTGIRKETGCGFQKSWVLEDINMVKPFAGKVNKRYRIKTDPDIHELLLYLKRDLSNKSEYLFLDVEGKPWTKHAVQHRLRVIRRNCDLPDHLIGCRVFRHTFGSSWVKMQGIGAAADYLGHSNIQLTRDYYTNIFLPYAEFGSEVLPYAIPKDYLAEMARETGQSIKKNVFNIVTTSDLQRMVR